MSSAEVGQEGEAEQSRDSGPWLAAGVIRPSDTVLWGGPGCGQKIGRQLVLGEGRALLLILPQLPPSAHQVPISCMAGSGASSPTDLLPVRPTDTWLPLLHPHPHGVLVILATLGDLAELPLIPVILRSPGLPLGYRLSS